MTSMLTMRSWMVFDERLLHKDRQTNMRQYKQRKMSKDILFLYVHNWPEEGLDNFHNFLNIDRSPED